jgi:mannose-1-phosphate guanylyltransferase/mannose-6-phosphate isomerase
MAHDKSDNTNKKQISIRPVILCGGAGTRLWPLSRMHYPKQFCQLLGEETLFQHTLKRITLDQTVLKSLGPKVTFLPPVIVASEAHQMLLKTEIESQQIKDYELILEPVAKNTAPAIALSAFYSKEIDAKGDELLLIMPADHYIADHRAFILAIAEAADEAFEGNIVTFGITPLRPETGYGYIQYKTKANSPVKDVIQFVEKPDAKTASTYLESGDYAWNSGIFLMKTSVYLKELKSFEPKIYETVDQSYQAGLRDGQTLVPKMRFFSESPSQSIDYGILEKAKNIKVMPLSIEWNDLGSWHSVWEIGAGDDNGNTLIGDITVRDVKNSYIRSDNRLVAVIGLDDIVVVDNPDAILVASRSAAQDVKQVVEDLRAQNRQHAFSHSVEHRPWGSYQSIDRGERFQVKRISVKPGGRLSLQMHHHRAEHWVVVKGTAKVTRDDEVVLLFENESIYIPNGVKHRLENPGKIPLELIEVQSGVYLGEDDIVRFNDDYGRK